MKTQKKRSKKIEFFAILLALVTLSVFLGRKLINNEQPPSNLKDQSRVLKVILVARGVPDEWFTPSFDVSEPNADLSPAARNYIVGQWWEIQRRLSGYRAGNLVQLAALFERSMPGTVKRDTGNKITINMIAVKPVVITNMQQLLKIAFYGPAQTSIPDLDVKIPGDASYRPLITAICLPARIRQHPVMLDAIVLHELCHYQQVLSLTAFGSTLPATQDESGNITDLAADNEVAAHMVGAQVFDINTSGEYSRRIHSVVEAKGHVKGPIELVMKFSRADIIKIDDVLERPFPSEAGQRVMQYLFDSGRYWVNTNLPEQERAAEMRQFYRELRK